MAEKTPFARLIVRSDGLMLGKSFGLFEPDCVYQVELILGEFVIRKLGHASVNWDLDANGIISNGNHLYTDEEFRKLLDAKQRKE